MKFIDWFAGIGGFRRGMELAGHECVGFCEFDKYAVASYTAMHLCTPEQIEYLKTLPLNKRQKEIAKEEYRNGEWYANDIREVRGWSVPKANCWCFGAPCQDFSTSGNRSGLKGDRSSLVKEIFRILGEMQQEDRPEWLLYENVKGMLSSNDGFDFLAILLEMDGWGYDVQWQVLNSRDFGVPQSRDRVYTIGHLRRCGKSEILPIGATDEKDFIARNTPIIIDDFYTSRPIRAYDKYSPTLRSDRNGLKVLTNIDGETRRINKETGKYIQINPTLTIYVVYYPQMNCWVTLRRLTPKECFRLQGWTDDYFERAELVNSDSQLYKQARNGVTVNVVEAIAKRMK